MAGKVLWHVTMSLDGFITGPDDSMDWVFSQTDRSELGHAAIDTIGAILAGRRGYEVNRGPRDKPYGGAWSGPIFVLTHRPPAEDDPEVTFLSCDVAEAVSIGLKAADGKNLALFGADIPRQCLQLGLVDEILLHQIPILLGDGVRFFADAALAEPVRLERIECATSGQITDFRFRPLKP
ncbi:dihydrofolate reductase family protein [Actinomadura barringtoniae]|uniref:Dihydrofolate reductase family protein n=1 Tax=Actinomadura barringtoniae TaxID=1427535 RepID=A0A939TCJ1_9ACTN|nr:dihydrofolate reductase family protein [Actinomadura barringtoniae]MBO2454627.1 dihydrofolate reductase family protein [Actinomadura barringtoniae]